MQTTIIGLTKADFVVKIKILKITKALDSDCRTGFGIVIG